MASEVAKAIIVCWQILAGKWSVLTMNDYGHVDDDTPSFAISLYLR